MFGHDKDDDNKDDTIAQPMSTQPINNGLLGIDDDDTPSITPTPAPADEPAGPPVTPAGVDDFASPSSDPEPTDDVASDAPSTPPVDPVSSSSSSDDELLTIKREALQELSPLIDHLEQDADDKFRTTMMMIQASDNKELVPQAFKAAKEITDDKKRAQALLDIVNEINYFTHKSGDN